MQVNSTQPTFKSLYFNPKKIESKIHINAMNYVLRDASNADLMLKSKNHDIGMFFAKDRKPLEESIFNLFKDFKGIKIEYRPDIDNMADFLQKAPEIFKKFD